jgi:hypothetical protein
MPEWRLEAAMNRKSGFQAAMGVGNALCDSWLPVGSHFGGLTAEGRAVLR